VPRRPTRFVGYVRVSTKKQAEEGVSLDAQEVKLRAYVLALDLELVAIESDRQTAKNTDRAGLQRALAMLEDGKADGLLIPKLDRLTRKVADLGVLIERYFESRFVLLSMGDSIDTRTAGGRLVLNVIASVSQWEREVISERTKDALAHLRAIGGGTPRLEGPALARIAELHGEGLALRDIAETLTEEGVATLKGGKWGPSTVSKVLARIARDAAA
jgi:site-specific DNA recombinase